MYVLLYRLDLYTYQKGFSHVTSDPIEHHRRRSPPARCWMPSSSSTASSLGPSPPVSSRSTSSSSTSCAPRPLVTPSLVGAVVLQGASPQALVPVNLGLVAAFSVVHALLFCAFGVAASATATRLRDLPPLPLLALGSLLALEVCFYAATALIAPGLGAAIGHWVVLGGNALAAPRHRGLPALRARLARSRPPATPTAVAGGCGGQQSITSRCTRGHPPPPRLRPRTSAAGRGRCSPADRAGGLESMPSGNDA